MLSHACEHARTRGLYIASMDLPPHLYTYARATCKFLWDSGASAIFLQRNPSLGAPQVYPYRFLDTMGYQCTFSLT
jgi:hypothetical protein